MAIAWIFHVSIPYMGNEEQWVRIKQKEMQCFNALYG